MPLSLIVIIASLTPLGFIGMVMLDHWGNGCDKPTGCTFSTCVAWPAGCRKNEGDVCLFEISKKMGVRK